MKKILKVTILVLFVTVIGISAHAQVNPLPVIPDNGGPGAGGSGTSNINPPGSGLDGAVPFDGGLSLILLAAGAGLGAKKTKVALAKA